MTTALTPLGGIPKLAAAAARYVEATPAPEPCAITLDPGQKMIKLQPREARRSSRAHRDRGQRPHLVQALPEVAGRDANGAAAKLGRRSPAAAPQALPRWRRRVDLRQRSGSATTPDLVSGSGLAALPRPRRSSRGGQDLRGGTVRGDGPTTLATSIPSGSRSTARRLPMSLATRPVDSGSTTSATPTAPGSPTMAYRRTRCRRPWDTRASPPR
jgi:hypothetical protein